MEMFDLSNGRLGLSSVETLYSYVQRVYLKPRKGEEKAKMLRITMEMKSESTVLPGKVHFYIYALELNLEKTRFQKYYFLVIFQVLCLQITDDSDCAFFYSLILTQDDFTVLKCQQGLLVDFDNFPCQLIKLFEVCKSQDITK